MENSAVEQLRRLLEAPIERVRDRTFNPDISEYISRMYPNTNYFANERLDAEPDYDDDGKFSQKNWVLMVLVTINYICYD